MGTIWEKVKEGFDDENNTNQFSSLDILCIIHWLIRTTCFQKIINNYSLLLSLWEEPFLEKLDAETSARIKGRQSQMESFRVFFGLCLGQKPYGLIDNLSKTLQKKKMSAISRQRLAFVH